MTTIAATTPSLRPDAAPTGSSFQLGGPISPQRATAGQIPAFGFSFISGSQAPIRRNYGIL
jgi:hypothetical protein